MWYIYVCAHALVQDGEGVLWRSKHQIVEGTEHQPTKFGPYLMSVEEPL